MMNDSELVLRVGVMKWVILGATKVSVEVD